MNAGESQILRLSEEQVQKYYRSIIEATKRSARYIPELVSLNREQRADQERLDNFSSMKTNVETKHKRMCHTIDEMKKGFEKVAEHIRSVEKNLQNQRKLRLDLHLDVSSSRERAQEIQKQLDDISEHEDALRQRKQEIVELLQSLFPGVYDRMVNLCQPVRDRYRIAITEVLGKYVDAIVVDTEHTAKKCIMYLKYQRLDQETFLPLDFIQCNPIKEHLRNIREPKGVKLIYDVLQFDLPAIEKAVMFATNNALVCESTEDAMKVAYELGESLDAVSLDGTYYQKSGLISGGLLDLTRRAKRWDDKLKDARKKSRKESKLKFVDLLIRELDMIFKYAKTEMEISTKELKEFEAQLATVSVKINQYGRQVQDIESSMLSRQHQIKEINIMMKSVQDEVFSAFCQEIGVGREVKSIVKDMQAEQKSLVSLETKMESKKSDRRAILLQCKMEDIAIPMLVGNIEDILTGDKSQASSSSDSTSSSLEKAEETLSKIETPNLKAMEKLQLAENKMPPTNEELETLRNQSNMAKAAFQRIKHLRYKQFSRCFDHVSNEIDNIYKSLAQDQSPQAFLVAENPEEPYLDGINYSCVASGKRFQLMSNMSGDEKSIAALALIFAIHSFQPTSFLILNEVDATLDSANVEKIAMFIREKAKYFQFIVISHNEKMFANADVLIRTRMKP